MFLYLQEDTETTQALADQKQMSDNCLTRAKLINDYRDRCEKEQVDSIRPRQPLDPKQFDLATRARRNKLSPPQEVGKKTNPRYTAKQRSYQDKPITQSRVPKATPAKSRKRRDSILSNASSKRTRTEKGTIHQDRKEAERTALDDIKDKNAPRMLQAGSIPKDLREKIINMTRVINFIKHMVQNCVITLVNFCHEKSISLEPLIKGSGEGGHNFIVALFVHFKNLVRGEPKQGNEFEPGSPQDTLITLAKQIYNPSELSRIRNLADSNGISFDLVYTHFFADAASQVDSQLGKIVKGRISQLERDILSATPETDPLYHVHKRMIAKINEEHGQDKADFAMFLKLHRLAPDHLKPTFAPLSRPTDSFVHINESSLFLNLAPPRVGNQKRVWQLRSTKFDKEYVKANPGHLLNALFNTDESNSIGSRVWRTRSGKKLTKFVFSKDHIDGDRKL